MEPVITAPTSPAEIPDRLKTSRAALIPRSVGELGASAPP
jgi:hypothetical protein